MARYTHKGRPKKATRASKIMKLTGTGVNYNSAHYSNLSSPIFGEKGRKSYQYVIDHITGINDIADDINRSKRNKPANTVGSETTVFPNSVLDEIMASPHMEKVLFATSKGRAALNFRANANKNTFTEKLSVLLLQVMPMLLQEGYLDTLLKDVRDGKVKNVDGNVLDDIIGTTDSRQWENLLLQLSEMLDNLGPVLKYTGHIINQVGMRITDSKDAAAKIESITAETSMAGVINVVEGIFRDSDLASYDDISAAVARSVNGLPDIQLTRGAQNNAGTSSLDELYGGNTNGVNNAPMSNRQFSVTDNSRGVVGQQSSVRAAYNQDTVARRPVSRASRRHNVVLSNTRPQYVQQEQQAAIYADDLYGHTGFGDSVTYADDALQNHVAPVVARGANGLPKGEFNVALSCYQFPQLDANGEVMVHNGNVVYIADYAGDTATDYPPAYGVNRQPAPQPVYDNINNPVVSYRDRVPARGGAVRDRVPTRGRATRGAVRGNETTFKAW